MSVLCNEAWEPAGGAPDRGSHRCSLPADHVGLHRCGVCWVKWGDHAEYFIRNTPCPHGDETCPCQDNDICHYEGPDPMYCPLHRTTHDHR